jgi:hypothetical protein
MFIFAQTTFFFKKAIFFTICIDFYINLWYNYIVKGKSLLQNPNNTRRIIFMKRNNIICLLLAFVLMSMTACSSSTPTDTTPVPMATVHTDTQHAIVSVWTSNGGTLITMTVHDIEEAKDQAVWFVSPEEAKLTVSLACPQCNCEIVESYSTTSNAGVLLQCNCDGTNTQAVEFFYVFPNTGDKPYFGLRSEVQ